VVDREADVHMDMAEHLGEIPGGPMERVGVQQHHRTHPLGASQERREQRWVGAVHVQVGVAEPGVDLERPARAGGLPDPEPQQHPVRQPCPAGPLDLGEPAPGRRHDVRVRGRVGVDLEAAAIRQHGLERHAGGEGLRDRGTERRRIPRRRDARPCQPLRDRLEPDHRLDPGAREGRQRGGGDEGVGLEAGVHEQRVDPGRCDERPHGILGTHRQPTIEERVAARERLEAQGRRAPATHGDAQLGVPAGDRARPVRLGEHRQIPRPVGRVADEGVDVVIDEHLAGDGRVDLRVGAVDEDAR